MFTTTCIPRFLYNMSTGDIVITYKVCFIQLFLTCLFEVTGFFLLATMPYDRYIAICKLLHYMMIMSNKLCKTMVIAAAGLAALMTILPSLSLDFHLKFCDSSIIDHFAIWPFWCITPPEDLMLRHMVNWADSYSLFCTDLHHHSSLCSYLLHIHHKDNSKIPFSSTKKKSFFNMFFPNDCTFHLLWQLHLHLYQTICKRRGKY